MNWWVFCFLFLLERCSSAEGALVVSEGLDELDDNSDGVLDKNVLLLRYCEWAQETIEHISQLEELGLIVVACMSSDEEDGTFSSMFGEKEDLVFLKVGTHMRHLDVLFLGRESQELDQFLRDCTWVEIGWVNFENDPIQIFWQDDSGTRHDVGRLEHGEQKTEWRQTFIGHRFVLVWENGTEKEYVVVTDQFHRIGDFQSLVGSRPQPKDSEYSNLENYENNRAHRIKKNFTSTGYKRIRTPRKLFADIRRYWNMNRGQSFNEDWKGKGIYVNYWDVDAKMVPPSFRMKDRWHDMFRPYLEEWSGVELEPTAIYGIRTYQRGARLLSHVDREQTHAISAIINVEQSPDLEEDWELEIVDVNWVKRYSPMEEGDAMYYESARCLHGRPKPLKGSFYANVFFHYRPVGGNIRWFDDEEEAKPEDVHDEEDDDEDFEDYSEDDENDYEGFPFDQRDRDEL